MLKVLLFVKSLRLTCPQMVIDAGGQNVLHTNKRRVGPNNFTQGGCASVR